MWQNILKFLIIFLAVMLQVSFFPNLVPLKVFPDIALLIILFWTVKNGFEEIWPWAILAGFLVDIAYFWPVGISVFSFVLISYAANSAAKRFLVQQAFSRFLILAGLIFLGTVANEIIVNFSIELIQKETVDFYFLAFAGDVMVKSAYNLLLFSLIYAPLKKMEKIFNASLNQVKIAG